MALIVACASDDGISFVDRHFGDADYYYIYRLDEGKTKFIKRIANSSEEEKMHADPEKAKGIVQLLREENVQAGITKVFGPNIKRVKKNFVPVLVSVNEIEKGLEIAARATNEIIKMWDQGEERQHLDLRKFS